MRLSSARCKTLIFFMAFMVMIPCAYSQTDPLDSSSFIGGSGTDDMIRRCEIQSNGNIVLAGKISSARPGGLNPILLNGATSSTSGAVIRLSPDGRTVLSVTRLATDIWDVSLDSSDNIYVAARSSGLIKLNSTASSMLWKVTNGGSCDRVDAASNGNVVGLKGSWSDAGWTASGAGTIYVYNSSGTQLGSFAGHNRTQDVAIDSTSQSVYSIGWQNKTMSTCHSQGANQPVQVSYIKSHSHTGSQKWKAYDWSGDQACGSEADNRGACIEMGRDGKLYCGFRADGGDHIFRYSPYNISQSVTIVGGDKYHQFYNSKSEAKSVFGRYDPANGNVLLVQQFTARLTSGAANTCSLYKGNIAADENGRVYITGSTASGGGTNNADDGLPYTFDPIPSTEYGGGAFVLIMSADFKSRLLVTRSTSNGNGFGVAARIINGSKKFVWCGDYGGSSTLYRKNALQSTSGGSREGFFQAKSGLAIP